MYNQYVHYVHDIVSRRDISTFKANPDYRGILEHVSVAFGQQYYDILRKEYMLSDDTIASFCATNDAIGSPIKDTIGSLPFQVSPTSLRYLLHAMTTIDHVVSQTYGRVDIVEVGCGYGGFILALDFVSKLRNVTISTYTCVDLDEPIALQKLYLQNFSVSFPIEFHSASTYGRDIARTNLFLVSMYCFSEIERQHQVGYLEYLFPKVSHGIMLWNHIPVFDFGKNRVSIETEKPMTGPGNKLVLF